MAIDFKDPYARPNKIYEDTTDKYMCMYKPEDCNLNTEEDSCPCPISLKTPKGE